VRVTGGVYIPWRQVGRNRGRKVKLGTCCGMGAKGVEQKKKEGGKQKKGPFDLHIASNAVRKKQRGIPLDTRTKQFPGQKPCLRVTRMGKKTRKNPKFELGHPGGGPRSKNQGGRRLLIEFVGLKETGGN